VESGRLAKTQTARRRRWKKWGRERGQKFVAIFLRTARNFRQCRSWVLKAHLQIPRNREWISSKHKKWGTTGLGNCYPFSVPRQHWAKLVRDIKRHGKLRHR